MHDRISILLAWMFAGAILTAAFTGSMHSKDAAAACQQALQ